MLGLKYLSIKLFKSVCIIVFFLNTSAISANSGNVGLVFTSTDATALTSGFCVTSGNLGLVLHQQV